VRPAATESSPAAREAAREDVRPVAAREAALPIAPPAREALVPAREDVRLAAREAALPIAPPAREAARPAARRGLAPSTPPPAPRGRTFARAELEVHASGRISELFGERFREQDAHAVQVRMPEPPLLLADRVSGLDAEPASMQKGTVWTETDVRPDAFYLHDGRMPAGLMIEAGQADLFLISYLGADLSNRGERRYRLLGCTLTWHRSPPRPGETL